MFCPEIYRSAPILGADFQFLQTRNFVFPEIAFCQNSDFRFFGNFVFGILSESESLSALVLYLVVVLPLPAGFRWFAVHFWKIAGYPESVRLGLVIGLGLGKIGTHIR